MINASSRTTSDHHELLALYLDDHWAGAGGGAALARRLSESEQGGAWSAPLADVAAQVVADERTLRQVRDALDVDGGALKRSLALVGERLGRLKSNRRIVSRSPLSRVLEAELLMAGVSAKQRLWQALRSSIGDRSDLASFDLDDLVARAEAQLSILADFHVDVARGAFTDPGDGEE